MGSRTDLLAAVRGPLAGRGVEGHRGSSSSMCVCVCGLGPCPRKPDAFPQRPFPPAFVCAFEKPKRHCFFEPHSTSTTCDRNFIQKQCCLLLTRSVLMSWGRSKNTRSHPDSARPNLPRYKQAHGLPVTLVSTVPIACRTPHLLSKCVEVGRSQQLHIM